MKDFEFDVKKPIKVFPKVQQVYLKIIQKDSCFEESSSHINSSILPGSDQKEKNVNIAIHP